MHQLQTKIVETVQALLQQETDRVKQESNPARRQLWRLLYEREKKTVIHWNMVSLHRAEREGPIQWKRLILPFLAVTANCVSLGCWLALLRAITPANQGWIDQYLNCVSVQLLSLAISGCTLYQALSQKNMISEAEMVVDEEARKQYLLEVENRTASDVQTIEAVFAQEMVTSDNQYEEASAEVYCALREMQADAQLDGDTAQVDALTWPLSQAKRLVSGMNCEEVEYSPETEAMFDVMDADVEQQRRPAIVQRDSGVVRLRGLYLRQRKMG